MLSTKANTCFYNQIEVYYKRTEVNNEICVMSSKFQVQELKEVKKRTIKEPYKKTIELIYHQSTLTCTVKMTRFLLIALLFFFIKVCNLIAAVIKVSDNLHFNRLMLIRFKESL